MLPGPRPSCTSATYLSKPGRLPGKDAVGKKVRGSAYKWLGDTLLHGLPPQRAAQEAAALAEPAGLAMDGFRVEQGALEQQAALHLLRKALALCPPAWTGDRCRLLAPRSGLHD